MSFAKSQDGTGEAPTRNEGIAQQYMEMSIAQISRGEYSLANTDSVECFSSGSPKGNAVRNDAVDSCLKPVRNRQSQSRLPSVEPPDRRADDREWMPQL
jgi:hypothetical protein